MAKSRSAKKTAKVVAGKGFLVRFAVQTATACVKWKERIERPVSDEKIVKAVKLAKVVLSMDVDAQTTSDYGGIILAGGRPCGDYFIEIGSEIR